MNAPVPERSARNGPAPVAGDVSPTAPADPAPKKRRIMRLSVIPTLITLGNTVCGVLAISYLIDAGRFAGLGKTAEVSDRVTLAAWTIVLGMVFDMLDGRVARLTRSTSNFGGALDSLADVLTFGVAPALLAKVLAEHVLDWSHPRAAFVTAVFYAVCATLRLARYNAEHVEPDEAVRNFAGLPTPGAAGVLAGIGICHERLFAWIDVTGNPDAASWAARILCYGGLLGLGLLMVSRVPYAHFANRLLGGKRPIGRVAILVLIVALAFANDMPELLVAAGFLSYALLGPISVIPRLLRRRREAVPELLDA